MTVRAAYRRMRRAAILWLAFLFLVSFLCLSAFANVPPDALRYRAELTRQARMVWGMDAPVATFAAQVHQESLWKPHAVSPASAQGIAQFMPGTSDWISGIFPALKERQPFNPSWGFRAMAHYNQWIWDRVSAVNTCERMAFVLSAYNGGLGWVNRDKDLAQKNGFDRFRWFDNVEKFNSGRSAASFRENRHYPRRILRQHEPVYIRAGFGAGSCA
ncbi:soluble lytic murein transglycosylase-like protein [Paraburkholderia atlantica]|uniref:transglycosylase SLT domain-containing protein n=1 Tax=Paraburkholderia atlantica TaxID=2654982 RepID=UPI003D1B458B